MYCLHCGKVLKQNEQFCPSCGFKLVQEINHCINCGYDIKETDCHCPHCGYKLEHHKIQMNQKSKGIAIILGVVFSGLGIYNFYLGYSSKGFIQLCLFFAGFITFGITSIISIVWAFVEVVFIMMGFIERDGDDNPL